MARGEYFRRNAETCLSYVHKTADEKDRTLWLARAERWLQLAREAEVKADDEPLTPGMPRLLGEAIDAPASTEPKLDRD